MTNEIFDVIVIGGGPAGIGAASKVREMGKKVALIERGRLGGVSTNDGCIPVRALAHAARLARESEQFEVYGLQGSKPTVDFAKVLARVRQVVDNVHMKKDLLGQLQQVGVTVYTNAGDAAFIDQHTIAFPDGREFKAEKFIICVGGHGQKLPFPGNEYALIHSDIWSLKELPGTVVIPGTGATGCQLASVLNAFGSKVWLLERSQRILKTEDSLVGDVMGEEFQKRGIKILYGYQGIKGIDKQPDGSLKFIYTHSDEERSIDCDAVILATGWPGNTEKLNLEAAGVKVNKKGYIEVNEYLQTNAPNIYAAGDVTGRLMVVSGATYDARIAADNAVLGNKRTSRRQIVPIGSFTDPEYASVGLREHQVPAEQEYITAVIYYRDFVRAVIDDRTAGLCKLIADLDSRQILGAHVVGERAVETVNLIAAAMKTGVRVEQLAELELGYPTYVAIVGLTARELARKLGEAIGAGYWRNHLLIPTSKSL